MAGRARKTFQVDRLKEMINNQLSRPDLSTEKKEALAVLLETVLFEANAYRGFTYPVWNSDDFAAHLEAVRAKRADYKKDWPESCDEATRRYL